MALPDPSKFGATVIPDPTQFGASQTSAVGGQQEYVGQRPLTPSEQTAQDILAKTSFAPEAAAGAGTIAKTSFADNPELIVQEFAKNRFPNEPLEEAMSRYAVIGDNIIYKADDGKYYSEIPKGYSPESLLKRGAQLTGKSIPFATGTAAGIASAPLLAGGPAGVAGSVGITGAASAGGEALRQYLGKQMMGDPISTKDIAIEGALGGLGQTLAAIPIRYAGKGIASDIGRLNMDEALKLQAKANKLGIQLTPAELTNLSSLKAQQKMLGNIAGTSDEIGDFYLKRAGQVGKAVEKQLGAISPVDSAEIAGQMTREAAGKAMGSIAEQRAAQASPIYKRAFRSGAQVDVSPVTKYIDAQLKVAKGPVKNALTKAKSLLYENVPKGKEAAIDTSVEGLHQAKLAIDDMIESSTVNIAKRQSSIGNIAKGQLRQVQKQLLKALDDASDDYKAARQIFADLSPEVSQVREGLTGIIADLPDTKLQTAAAALFNPSKVGPNSVRLAREQISKANPEAWQAIKRSWLQDQWENAGKEYATSSGKLNQGAKFRALIFGDEKRKRIMKEALTPDEYTALNDMSNVLQAVGRVKPVGSDTTWNNLMVKQFEEDAKPISAKIAEKSEFWKLGKSYSDWATQKAFEKRASDILNIVTNPQSLEKLKELRRISPSSTKAASIVGSVLRIIPSEKVSIEGERIGERAYPDQNQ